jgi:hypothetical protein
LHSRCRPLLSFTTTLLVLTAFEGLDGSRSDVGFPLGLVVVESDDYVGDEDDVGDDGGGGAGVG